MFAVCVTLHIAPDNMAAFLPIIEAQAAHSLAREPDCHRFDICGGPEGALFLYELYTNAAAFAAHLQTPHFQEFDAAAAPLIERKDIATYAWVNEGSRE